MYHLKGKNYLWYIQRILGFINVQYSHRLCGNPNLNNQLTHAVV